MRVVFLTAAALAAVTFQIPVLAGLPHYGAFDVSASSAMTAPGSTFYRRANQELAPALLEFLRPGDVLHITTIGETGADAISVDEKKVRHPQAIAQALTRYVTDVGTGKVAPQQQTALWSYFALSPISCEKGSRVFVVTDGIAVESDVDIRPAIEAGSAEGLPPLGGQKLAQCEVIFVGVGVDAKNTLTTRQRLNLEAAWKAFALREGAASVRFLVRR